MGKEKTIEKPKAPTAKQLLDQMLLNNPECTPDEMMIEFANIHVLSALEKASKKFKNADNIRFIKKAYPSNNII